MSSHANLAVDCRTLDLDQIDLIRPVWEKLNAHHAGISACFSGELRVRCFKARKSLLLASGKRFQILIVTFPGSENAKAYCVASLTSSGEGEIDSIFVEEKHRGSGIGADLVRRALAWLDECGATTKSVVVLFENIEVTKFYARFGFHPRNATLIHKKEST
jgi:GNAT superfamily N-acetyltransferase